VLLVGMFVVTGTPALAADKATDPVIFVRGYTGAAGVSACPGDDVQAYFKRLPDTIASYGWNRKNFRFVGFYACDHNLTSGQYGYDWLNRYNERGQNWETGGWWNSSDCEVRANPDTGPHANENCDINNLAYHLAWFIYWNFTVKNQTVHLIGHSLGGLMIRSALYEQPRQSVFPPKLLVESAVTIGAPYLGASVTTPLNQQGREMRGRSDYLNSRNTVGRPQGAGGTEWLTIGSSRDSAVSQQSATNMCCSGMHKVVYDPGLSGDAPDHTQYFDDTWGTRISPTRSACWGTTDYHSNTTLNADNVGPMIERGLSGVWQNWPANAGACPAG
jgi:pimeloyl-ACP methyl ester carboxylesterase